AGYPIRNSRTTVENRDVAEVLREAPGGFDAIMLDVDNGPEGLTADDNDWLYSAEGLAICARALRPAGILAVWSATADARFSQRLSRAGFKAEARQVYAHGTSGAKHTIWIARYIGRSATSETGSGAGKGEKKGKRAGGSFKGAGAKGSRRR
ncbi:polyamine aminopropyltransferase, partial [Cobetia marina]